MQGVVEDILCKLVIEVYWLSLIFGSFIFGLNCYTTHVLIKLVAIQVVVMILGALVR